MKKLTISKLFLYRHRFAIGYSVLGLAFLVLVTMLPLWTPNGLSEAEMASAVTSSELNLSSIPAGDLVDAPYHLLQKLSISIFGLSSYSITIPSILIGIALGFLLVLLLNRWFKNNVALFASIITILSTPFLYLAGSGTPLIMLVFWPVLLLWLGSKIQGKKKPSPTYCFLFAIALFLSMFTPLMIYLAIFILLFALLNPHLRHTIKNLPRVPLILISLFIVGGLVVFGIGCFTLPGFAPQIFTAEGFTWQQYFSNIRTGIAPFFISVNSETPLLSPLFGLAAVALAVVGLISTVHGFFASRNAIASCLIVFAIILSGFNPGAAFLLIIPFAILVAHGLRYTLEKWYGLFPENPYARIFAIFPISLFLGLIIISDLVHYTSGYRYNPPVANQFTNDLALVRSHLLDSEPPYTLYVENAADYEFYNILSTQTNLQVTNELPQKPVEHFASLGKPDQQLSGNLVEIITSPKSADSDRIYIYNNAVAASAVSQTEATNDNEE